MDVSEYVVTRGVSLNITIILLLTLVILYVSRIVINCIYVGL